MRVMAPAVIENNVFVGCGNSAIGVLLDVQRVAIEGNLFFASPRSVITCTTAGFKGEIKEKNLEELEDIGFKACAGNVVQDPAITGPPSGSTHTPAICSPDMPRRRSSPPTSCVPPRGCRHSRRPTCAQKARTGRSLRVMRRRTSAISSSAQTRFP